MAEEDLDLDTENAGKGKTNLLIIILIVVVLAVGGGVAAMFFIGGDDSKPDAESGKGEEEHAAPKHAPAIYSTLRPTFVINFEDTSKARYVQIDMDLMSRDQHSIDLVQEHSPVIRNNIIAILSSQTFAELNTRAGKEKLQASLLKSINETLDIEVKNLPVVKTDGDDAPAPKSGGGHAAAGHQYIEAVFFTSFVMQ